MKKNEITVGAHYVAKVNGRLTTVRVDDIWSVGVPLGGGSVRDTTRYNVTNLTTGRKTTFRSATKFRKVVAAVSSETDTEIDVTYLPPPTPKVDNEAARINALIAALPAEQQASAVEAVRRHEQCI